MDSGSEAGMTSRFYRFPAFRLRQGFHLHQGYGGNVGGQAPSMTGQSAARQMICRLKAQGSRCKVEAYYRQI